MTDSAINPSEPYVRTDMVPQQPPPTTSTGVVKWVTENLLSSPLNIGLTLAAIYVIWGVLSTLLPWLGNSIWFADSLTECRAIRDASFAPGASSACFAVITERWPQLLFGFYPSDGYWRPVLALVVFLVAISPLLFPGVPRQMFWLAPFAPFTMFWLLWGGSLWWPVAIALGFVLGFVAFRVLAVRAGTLVAVLAAIAVPLIYWMFLNDYVAAALQSIVDIQLPPVLSRNFGGFTLSLIIGISAICLSLPLGILLALGRQSDMFIINKLCVTFIEVIRGVPLIVWLFTAQLLLNYFLPRGTNFDLMLRVIIMVTLFSAAYIAEVVRGGLAALPKGQYEAANALGLDYWQAMRQIILPQALKVSIPGIVNTFIGLFKDTTLVTFIGMYDPMGFSRAIRTDADWNGIYWEIYVFIAVIFFLFCFAMSRYSMYLERRLRRENR